MSQLNDQHHLLTLITLGIKLASSSPLKVADLAEIYTQFRDPQSNQSLRTTLYDLHQQLLIAAETTFNPVTEQALINIRALLSDPFLSNYDTPVDNPPTPDDPIQTLWTAITQADPNWVTSVALSIGKGFPTTSFYSELRDHALRAFLAPLSQNSAKWDSFITALGNKAATARFISRLTKTFDLPTPTTRTDWANNLYYGIGLNIPDTGRTQALRQALGVIKDYLGVTLTNA